MESGDPISEQSAIKITVKFGGRSIPISLSPDSTVEELKTLLQPITNVLHRGQKLIFKGKVLVDKMILRQAEVGNGAKIMLMASQGLHQGEGPVLKEAESWPISRTGGTDKRDKERPKVLVDKNRVERWKATGVIALSECNLKAIPEEVWGCRTVARVLEISNNCIQEVPAQISSLSSTQKLFLNGNSLLDEAVQWEGITSLKLLTLLSISHNNLTTLPSALGSLTSLRQLNVANNKLASLPDEIGLLTQLEVLKANNNRLNSVPTSIGNCTSFIEVDLSSNLLSDLPETFSNLFSLKALYLSNNGLKTLPSALFKMCCQLMALDLHNTEITMDVLRQFEGWGDFDERRRSKHQKQLDFRVVGSGEFDEGADKNW